MFLNVTWYYEWEYCVMKFKSEEPSLETCSCASFHEHEKIIIKTIKTNIISLQMGIVFISFQSLMINKSPPLEKFVMQNMTTKMD